MSSKCTGEIILWYELNRVKLSSLIFFFCAATPEKCADNGSKNDLELTLLKCKEYEKMLHQEKSALAERHQLWVARGRRIKEDRKYYQLQRNLFRKSN